MADRGAAARRTAEVAGRPSVHEARAWIGFRLDEISGAGVGRVEGIYVDARHDTLEWLLVRRGRFGVCCLVPGREAVDAGGRVWVPWDRTTIRRSPGVEPGTPLKVDDELELCAHYGIAEGVGRTAQLAGRSRSETSLRPAD
jgi:hypothetical protein